MVALSQCYPFRLMSKIRANISCQYIRLEIIIYDACNIHLIWSSQGNVSQWCKTSPKSRMLLHTNKGWVSADVWVLADARKNIWSSDANHSNSSLFRSGMPCHFTFLLQWNIWLKALINVPLKISKDLQIISAMGRCKVPLRCITMCSKIAWTKSWTISCSS